MPRPTPTRGHAAGMLQALIRQHTCSAACTSTVTLGDNTQVHLVCPWPQLDLDNAADRRIIQGVYASEARAATPKAA